MSITSQSPSNREWLRRLVSGTPHQVIGGAEDPYMRRWYLIPRNPVLNVYLHQFLRSDDDRALHDHPWWFVSLILRGHYMEVTENAGRTTSRHRRAGSIAFRTATFRHRVALPAELRMTVLGSEPEVYEKPCWTLIVTGRRTRDWGFWCKRIATDAWDDRVQEVEDRFIPWQDFGDAGCGELS